MKTIAIYFYAPTTESLTDKINRQLGQPVFGGAAWDIVSLSVFVDPHDPAGDLCAIVVYQVVS